MIATIKPKNEYLNLIFEEDGLAVKCNVYDCPNAVSDNDYFHITDMAEILKQMGEYTTAICSFWDIDKFTDTEDYDALQKYRLLMSKAIGQIRSIHKKVVFITRLDGGATNSIYFLHNNEFVSTYILTPLENGEPFLFLQDELSHKVWDYIFEHYGKRLEDM